MTAKNILSGRADALAASYAPHGLATGTAIAIRLGRKGAAGRRPIERIAFRAGLSLDLVIEADASGALHAAATPMIAVRDLDRAKAFYEGTLGLETIDEEAGEVLTMRSGDTLINVYRSEFAGTNKATSLTFEVDDIHAEVDELKGKSVAFEHYDMDGLTRNGDVYEAEGMKTAWFKDPDGNILSLYEGEGDSD